MVYFLWPTTTVAVCSNITQFTSKIKQNLHCTSFEHLHNLWTLQKSSNTGYSSDPTCSTHRQLNKGGQIFLSHTILEWVIGVGVGVEKSRILSVFESESESESNRFRNRCWNWKSETEGVVFFSVLESKSKSGSNRFISLSRSGEYKCMR